MTDRTGPDMTCVTGMATPTWIQLTALAPLLASPAGTMRGSSKRQRGRGTQTEPTQPADSGWPDWPAILTSLSSRLVFSALVSVLVIFSLVQPSLLFSSALFSLAFHCLFCSRDLVHSFLSWSSLFCSPHVFSSGLTISFFSAVLVFCTFFCLLLPLLSRHLFHPFLFWSPLLLSSSLLVFFSILLVFSYSLAL